jgi:hypothetical protein
MPCDIGYKSFQEVYLPVPQPKKLSKKVEAPKVDLDLLEKIGEGSPEFIEWFGELDSDSLLGFVLSEVLQGRNLKGINFGVKDGTVLATTEYKTEAEKKAIEKVIDGVMNDFQMRTLKMIAEILGFETVIRERNGEIVIEGEKLNTDNNQVTRYLKISRGTEGKSQIMFEHYSSKKILEEERGKFTLLAQKFGLPVDFTLPRTQGSPIPTGEVHKGHLKEG